MDIESEIRNLKNNMKKVAIALAILVIMMVIIPLMSLIVINNPEFAIFLSVLQIGLAIVFLFVVAFLFSEGSWKNLGKITSQPNFLSSDSEVDKDEIRIYYTVSLLRKDYAFLMELENLVGRRVFVGLHQDNPMEFESEDYHVTKLSLTRTLPFLPISIGDLEELTYLDLSETDLNILPDSLTKLANLKLLNLTYNPLTSLPQDINKLQSLETLSLRKTELKDLPDSFWLLPELRELNLSQTKLLHLIPKLLELPKLKILHLVKSQHRKLPEVAKKALQTLQIKGCKILFGGIL